MTGGSKIKSKVFFLHDWKSFLHDAVILQFFSKTFTGWTQKVHLHALYCIINHFYMESVMAKKKKVKQPFYPERPEDQKLLDACRTLSYQRIMAAIRAKRSSGNWSILQKISGWWSAGMSANPTAGNTPSVFRWQKTVMAKMWRRWSSIRKASAAGSAETAAMDGCGCWNSCRTARLSGLRHFPRSFSVPPPPGVRRGKPMNATVLRSRWNNFSVPKICRKFLCFYLSAVVVP